MKITVPGEMNVIKDSQKILMNGVKIVPLSLNLPFLKVAGEVLPVPAAVLLLAVQAAAPRRVLLAQVAPVLGARAVVPVRRVMKKALVALLNN